MAEVRSVTAERRKAQSVPIAVPATVAAHVQMILSLGRGGHVGIVLHLHEGQIKAVSVDGVEHWKRDPGDKPWDLVVE